MTQFGGRRVQEMNGEWFVVETRAPQSVFPTEMTFASCDCARFVRRSTDNAVIIFHDVDCKELADGRS